MRNIHMVIVNNIGQMVGWQSIRLQQYWILERKAPRGGGGDRAQLLFTNLAIHQIDKFRRSLRRFQPYDMCFALLSSLFSFRVRDQSAGAVILVLILS